MKTWRRCLVLGAVVGLHLAAGALLAYLTPAGAVLAMATVGTTAGVIGNINEAMKIIFQDPISENFVTDSELLDLFQQETNVIETDGGRYIEMAHYFTLPAGVGARSLEGDYIPVPDGPVIKNSQVFLKKIEGVVQMSGDAMRRVRGDMGAFVNWAQRHLPDLVTRANHEIDRQLIGYGNGALARINDATPSKPLAVDSPYGIATLSKAWLTILEGQRVRFGPNADGTALRAGSFLVEDVNPETNEIDGAGALPAGLVDNDYIFPGDDIAASTQNAGVDREIMGLLGMVDDGAVLATFQGLARASFRKWQSIVVDADAGGAGTPFDGSLNEIGLTIADNRVKQRGDGKPTVVVTSVEGLVSYWDNLLTYKSINDPRSFTGGKSNLFILLGDRALEVRAARKMPPELTFLLQPDTFKRWHNTGWEWDDKTGSIWNRVTDATGRMDAYFAVGHFVLQTGNVAPRKNVKIKDLTLSAYA